MSSALIAILLIAGIMAATLVVAAIVLRRVGSRAEGRADELRDEVEAAGEEWVVPLAGAVYQGGGSPHTRSRGRGVLGLTDRRLVFLPIAGERVNVPRVRVSGVRTDERRRDATAAHRNRLVLTLDDGAEMSFLVDDGAAWRHALESE